MKRFKPYILCIMVFIGGVSAAPEGERFHLNGVYLFNVTSEANTVDVNFEGNNGFAGYVGYNIRPWLSVEAGGVYFEAIESVQDTGTTIHESEYDVSGYTLGLRGVSSFYGLFDLWGAVGLYSWESTFNYRITYPNFSSVERLGGDTNSSEDVYVRMGVVLPLTERLGLSAEMAQFELSDFFSDASGQDTDFRQRYIGLGVDYYF